MKKFLMVTCLCAGVGQLNAMMQPRDLSGYFKDMGKPTEREVEWFVYGHSAYKNADQVTREMFEEDLRENGIPVLTQEVSLTEDGEFQTGEDLKQKLDLMVSSLVAMSKNIAINSPHDPKIIALAARQAVVERLKDKKKLIQLYDGVLCAPSMRDRHFGLILATSLTNSAINVIKNSCGKSS